MGLFRRGVDPDEVMAKGHSGEGRIIGISSVREESVGEDFDPSRRRLRRRRALKLTVRRRRRTDPDPDRTVRLEMDVRVMHLDGKAIIDWKATCGGEINWIRLLKEPPAATIVDATSKLDKARRKGLPGSVTITGASIVDAMMGLRQVLRLDLVVRPDGVEAYDSTQTDVDVPHYASHLIDVGAVLPAWIDARRLRQGEDRLAHGHDGRPRGRCAPSRCWPASATSSPGRRPIAPP